MTKNVKETNNLETWCKENDKIDLLKQWNYNKNSKSPNQYSKASNKKVWWICKNGHEWEALICSRTRPVATGCPYCSGRKVIKGKNDLETLYPNIAKEWHPSKNGTLHPCEVLPKSNIKVWWRCSSGHEWNASIVNRTNLNRGCPECGKAKMTRNRHKTLLQTKGSLFDKYPEIAKEWHPTKNGKILPSNVMAGSQKKYWWKCRKGHEWEASICNRTSKQSGCPYCSGLKTVAGKTDLQTKYPELTKEWNYEKNGDLRPFNVAASSNAKVWWKCHICGHEWESRIGNRTQLGRGCPKCAEKIQKKSYRKTIVSKIGSLADTNPELAKEWHPIKNGSITPKDLSAGCSDKAWWLLPYDDPNTGKHFDFEWEASIASRNSGVGCPFLAGRCWTGFNDIVTTNPEVLKYWNFSKNNKSPGSYTKGAHDKVWWLCEYGHSFKSSIAGQCKKFSCPVCSKEKQTSFPEQAIYFYIRQVFPDAINGDRSILEGLELDIYIPSQNIGIEYDGAAWHKSIEKDIQKEIKCKQKGIFLYKVRENGCEKYDSRSFLLYHYEYGDWKALDKIIQDILNQLSNVQIDISIEKDIHDIEKMYFADKKNNSVAITNPELISLWHPTKNANLTLYHFNRGSEKIAWWKDSYGHEYKCKINQMTKGGEHCPYCSNRKLLVGFNDLQTRFPNVAAEWNYEKNGNVKPSDVRYNMGKYWFKCENCGNEWQANLNNRTRKKNPTGCPACAHKVAKEKRINNSNNKTNYGKSLGALYPNLVDEWDKSMNQIDVFDIFNYSSITKKFWWKCTRCGNKWSSTIKNRAKGRGCPNCANTKKVKNIDTGEVFNSIRDAANKYNCVPSSITNCCKGRIKTCQGYHWEYTDKENIKARNLVEERSKST